MSSALSGLNSRERFLLIVTLSLVSVIVTGAIAYKAWDHVSLLNRQIAAAEQDLYNLNTQIVQAESVDAAFSEVISRYSTMMTREEIHDSLRREIYRLALQDPGLPDNQQEAEQNQRYLVNIPSLPQGVLNDDGQGYREYQIRFRVPDTDIEAAVQFLSRLERSELLLRIDELELTRSALVDNQVSLDLTVTRTILDEVQSSDNDEDEFA